ncbi:hypothetical protein KW823_21870 [Enterobacter quasiroggenkampii]|nr:hypothetical protein [Enterobacter quasiroggenkampii]
MVICDKIKQSSSIEELVSIFTSATQPNTGRVAYVITPRGNEVKTAFKVVEAHNLVISNMLDGRINPNFPAELQPRDRTRKSSLLQVNSIASNITPQRLADSGLSSHGAPIIGLDNVVESGNGRTMGILKAYAEGGAEEYRKYLIDNSSLYGLNAADVSAMQNPVLVRVRLDDVDRIKFAKDSNISDLQDMAASEKAFADAEGITPELMALFSPADNGNLLAKSNDAFIQAFLSSLGETTTAGLVTADGRPTRQLLDRMQNAIFAKAYKNEMLVKLVAEEPDPEIRNILTALNVAAPAFVSMQYLSGEVHRQTVSEICSSVEAIDGLDKQVLHALVNAAELVRQAKDKGQTIDEYIQQLGLFDDISDEVKALTLFISRNNRSAKRMGTAFKLMAEVINEELQRSSAAVNDMFGAAPLNLLDVLKVVDQRISLGSENGNDLIKGLLFESSRSVQKKDITKITKLINFCKSVDDIKNLLSFLTRSPFSMDRSEKHIAPLLSKMIKAVHDSGEEKSLKELKQFVKGVLGGSFKKMNTTTDIYLIRDEIATSLGLENKPSAKNFVENFLLDGSILLLKDKIEKLKDSNVNEKEDLKLEIKTIVEAYLKRTKKFSRFTSEQTATLKFATDNKIQSLADYLAICASDRERMANEPAPVNPKEAMMNNHNVGQELLGGELLESQIGNAQQLVRELADERYMQRIGFMTHEERGRFLESLRQCQIGYGEAGDPNRLGVSWFYSKMDRDDLFYMESTFKNYFSQITSKITDVRDRLIDNTDVTDEEVSRWVSSIKIDNKFLKNERDKRVLLEELPKIFRLARGRIFTLREIIFTKSGRAYAQKGAGVIALHSFFDPKVLWHEAGHHFEYSNPNLLIKAKEYLKMKAGLSANILPLKDITNIRYEKKEVAIADHLSQPYIGRIYSMNGIDGTAATEVFSCGFEYLCNSLSGAQSLVNNDLLMQFVVGAIQDYTK